MDVASGGSTAAGVVITLLIVVVLVGLWLVPVYVAWQRKAAHFAAILIVDLLLGWTFIGWVAALAWAVADQSRIQTNVITNITTPPEADRGPDR